MQDPEFLAEAKRINLEVQPMSAEPHRAAHQRNIQNTVKYRRPCT